MGVLAWTILGLLIGLVAKVLSPGDDAGGVVLTPILGISES